MASKKGSSKKSSSKKTPSGEVTVRLSKSKTVPNAISQLIGNADSKKRKKTYGLAEHPLNLKRLPKHIDQSGLLQPNVKSYNVNIHTTGHRFEPVIDLNAPDAFEKVKDAMFVERLIVANDNEMPIKNVKEPSDEEVNEKLDEVKKISRLELALATNFFDSCVPDGDFINLRTRMGSDYEYLGGSYMEVLRGDDGKPRNLEHVAGHTIRIAEEDASIDNSVPVKAWQRVSALTYEIVQVRRTFKRFAEVDDNGKPVVWFKEFGDTRLMSQFSGIFYFDITDMVKAEGKDAKEATELFTFQQYSLTSDYGSPRWAGHLPSVLGSRELDEVNFDYFLNNAIPALALLVAGGRFGAGTQERLEEHFAEEVRGKRSIHKLVVLEAEGQKRGSNPSAIPKIEFVPLRNAQINDALFQVYDERNTNKVGSSFRLPGALVGNGDITMIALRFAEEQVYGPERDGYDARINKFLMPELGVMLWKFVSNTISPRDPEVVGTLTLEAANKGVIVPSEARPLLEKSLGFDLPELDRYWVDQPLPFTLAVLGVKAGPAEAVREQGRQAGNPAPDDLITADLGLTSEDGDITRANDSGALTTLDAIEALNRPKGSKKDND
jgi:capsid portal protein